MSKTYPSYYSAYIKLIRSNEQPFRFINLVDSLEFGSGRERKDLFEDIFTDNKEALNTIFADNKLEDATSLAFSECTALPNQCIKENRSIFSAILMSAIDGKYENATNTVYSNLYAFFSKKPAAFEVRDMQQILYNNVIPEKYRILFALAMTSHEDGLALIEWEKIEYKDRPFMVPAFVKMFQRNPRMAIEILAHVPSSYVSRYKEYFYSPVNRSLLNLARVEDALNVYLDLMLKLKSKTIRDLIKEIVSNDNRLKNIFYDHTLEEYVAKMNEPRDFESAIKEKIAKNEEQD